MLVIDEIGYLSYANRHADLSVRSLFSEWHEVFPNAACVVSLVDQLVHHSEIVTIDGDSYRMKEAQEKANASKTKRTRSDALKKRGPKR